MLIIFIFGYMFGWDNAGYTLVFQFVTTKVIDTFYNRYHRITLNIVTKKEKEVIKAYIENYRHGMTKFKANGAYSNEEVSFCYTVVSVYEVNDVVETILKADPSAKIHIKQNIFMENSIFHQFDQKGFMPFFLLS